MKQLFFYSLIIFLFSGCKKEPSSKVEIYLLKSFTSSLDQSITPAMVSINNAILEDAPLVTDQDIQFYTKATTTFTLRKDIQPVIQNYGSEKAFVVTIDQKPVYFGKFHPPHLSSMVLGVATITPFLSNKSELKINFIHLEGNSILQQLDKRNDSQIINTFKATNRLK